MAVRRNPNAGYGDEQDSLFSPRTTLPVGGGIENPVDAPRTNPGTSGPELPAPPPQVPDVPIAPPPAASPAAPHFATHLMEGDAGKLADPNHAAKSPKYDFLQLANKGTHNYDDLAGMIKELQAGPNSRLWNGWSADKDKLHFSGDPSQLASEWDGVKDVDAVGGYGDFAKGGTAGGFRWGVEDPNAALHSAAKSPGSFDSLLSSMNSQPGPQTNTGPTVGPDLQAFIKQIMDRVAGGSNQ